MNQLTDAALERAYLNELLRCHDAELVRRHIATPGRLAPSDCVALENGRILAKIHELCLDDEEVSPITAIAALERDGHGKAAAAVVAIGEDYEPRPDSFGSMSARLRELARARRIEALLRKAAEAVKNLNLEAAEEYAREVIGEAPEGEQQAQSLRSAAYLAAYGSGGAIGKIIRTGYPVIDQAIGGLRPGSMWMVGGRTNAGKSKLMLGSALQMARQGHRPGIVTCEDSLAVWGERALAHMTGVRPEQLQQPVRDMALKAKIDLGISMLSEEGIQLIDVHTRRLSDVLSAVRDLLANQKCDVIYVDYLQAIRLGQGAKRAELVSDAAQQLKSACQAHGAPLVLGSQLSRPDRSDPYAEPSAFALKESGDLENMAEVVTLQWKDSDDDSAHMLGKVAKVKWSPKRPRFQLKLCDAGSLQALEPIAIAPAQTASQSGWQQADRWANS